MSRCGRTPSRRGFRRTQPGAKGVRSRHAGASPSGKAPVFGTGIRRFESCRPSQTQVPGCPRTSQSVPTKPRKSAISREMTSRIVSGGPLAARPTRKVGSSARTGCSTSCTGSDCAGRLRFTGSAVSRARYSMNPACFRPTGSSISSRTSRAGSGLRIIPPNISHIADRCSNGGPIIWTPPSARAWRAHVSNPLLLHVPDEA